MNERVRKMVKESGLELYGLGKDRAKWEAALERFTALFVEECRTALCPALRDMISRGDGYRLIADRFASSIDVGDRVVVISGFNVGAVGTVNYIDPTGKVWVRRDRASTDVFYTLDELEKCRYTDALDDFLNKNPSYKKK